MVGTGEPQGAIALHTLKTHYDVLHSFVHSVTHMELTRDIGRGHNDSERNLVVIPNCLETALFFPVFI